MNGRCQKDALDRAEDICELCGNQYCASCLLFPRGHRNPPTCKSCALESSGLRGSGSKRQPISRREYKKRKKELLAQLAGAEEQEPAIEYFELKDPTPFDRSNELDRRTAVIEEAPTPDILAENPELGRIPPPPASPTPEPTPAPPAPAPATSADAFARSETESALAPVDTSINPLALGGSPSFPEQNVPQETSATSEASASAAELLARLKADQPIQSQFDSEPVGLDVDPFAQTSPAPTPAPAPAPAPTPTPAPAPAPAPAPSPAPAPAHAEAPAATPKSGVWSPPSPPPRGSNLGAMAAENSEPPRVPSTPAPSPSTLQPSPFATAAVASEDPTPSTPERIDVSPFGPANAPESETPSRRKADTDETGQWIPPSLRGMAASDERDPLPKRH